MSVCRISVASGISWRLFWAALVLLAGTISANGNDFFSGKEIHDGCEDNPVIVFGYVTGWFARRQDDIAAASLDGVGLVDTKIAVLKIQKKMLNRTCLPGTLDMGEFSNILCDYVADNSDKRGRRASELLAEALQKKFPCNSSNIVE